MSELSAALHCDAILFDREGVLANRDARTDVAPGDIGTTGTREHSPVAGQIRTGVLNLVVEGVERRFWHNLTQNVT